MKIGVGIVTCNRPEFLKKLYDSIDKSKIHELVIVNDGDALTNNFDCNIINNDVNCGVGITKNKAIKYLMENRCDFIFIVEDDMIIKSNRVWEEYIHACEYTGIQHFMFHAHGPLNKIDGKSIPRLNVKYSNTSISLYQHCVGSFCMYTLSSLEKTGLMDEKYCNAWEHVSHSYDLVKSGFAPAYWWWPDIENSTEYIGEQACSENNSSIRPRHDWQHNIIIGAKHFESIHTYKPWEVPDTDKSKVIINLLKIHSTYAIKSNKIDP